MQLIKKKYIHTTAQTTQAKVLKNGALEAFQT
jgi:hypothetical protein